MVVLKRAVIGGIQVVNHRGPEKDRYQNVLEVHHRVPEKDRWDIPEVHHRGPEKDR